MSALAIVARNEPAEPAAIDRDRSPSDKRGFRAHLRAADSQEPQHAAKPKPARGKANAPATDDDSETPVATPQAALVQAETPTAPIVIAPTGEAPPLKIAAVAAPQIAQAIDAAPAPVLAPVAPAAPPVAEALAALTPLEQAVHDLVEQLRTKEPHDEPHVDAPPVLAAAPAVADTPGPEIQVPVTMHAMPVEPKPLPEATNPSHVHLVLDDGPERIVVTVAVRGKEVNVALRGHDDATTASLARNAGSLDHAMRARGLDLASFSSARDDEPRHQPRERYPEPEADDEPYDQFSFEELT